ncbi:ABC transporter ATP-binding protein [Rhodoblastus sp.]|uniref:ABC transporter ATP-binding protein n=1 Tax=Rhodoblastus sp. TaxID=1962975 RepID=UPI003FD86960
MPADDLLRIEGLTVAFGATPVVDNVSLRLERGRTLGLVGESGSGKSVTALSVVRLLAPGAKILGGRIFFQGHDLLKASEAALRAVRGARIGMVFQEPMTSLNPLHRIERQIGEILEIHGLASRDKRRARTLELLREVGLQNAEKRLDAFPHELSGGQRQRVMIAMALANNPDLLIADEPTTALDVTIQAQILDLLISLRRQNGMSLLLITHDMGVVAETADRVIVQYAGQKVESNDTRALFEDPHHPYTAALLAALPERARGRRLTAIPGVVPGQYDRPRGCLFSPRCAFVFDRCRQTAPAPGSAFVGEALCHTPLVRGVPQAGRFIRAARR